MAISTQRFPLFNRIVVIVGSVGVLAFIAFCFTRPQFRDDLNLITVFLILTFVAMAIAAIWFSLFWRSEATAKQLAELLVGQPDYSPGSLICEFSTGFAAARVIIDIDRDMIHFGNCHAPRDFLKRTDKWFSCPFLDLKGVYPFTSNDQSTLTISTIPGKVTIPDDATHFSIVQEYLTAKVPRNAPQNIMDDPAAMYVYLGGALIGMFCGAILHRIPLLKIPGNWELGVYMVLGALAGSLICGLLVYSCGRWLKKDLLKPIRKGIHWLSVMMPMLGLFSLFTWEIALPLFVIAIVFSGLYYHFKLKGESLKSLIGKAEKR